MVANLISSQISYETQNNHSMKTIKRLWMIALIPLLFEGCKGDDQAPAPDQSELLIGTWEALSFVASNCSDPTDNENTSCTTSCEIMVATSTSLTFDNEGPYTYTAKGNSLTINFDG